MEHAADNFSWLIWNFLPPGLSLLGMVLLSMARQENPNAARGLGLGLGLSLIGSGVVSLPVLFIVISAGDNPLGGLAMATAFYAIVGAGVWLVLLLGGYGVGYLFSRVTSPDPSPASASEPE